MYVGKDPLQIERVSISLKLETRAYRCPSGWGVFYAGRIQWPDQVRPEECSGRSGVRSLQPCQLS